MRAMGRGWGGEFVVHFAASFVISQLCHLYLLLPGDVCEACPRSCVCCGVVAVVADAVGLPEDVGGLPVPFELVLLLSAGEG